MGHLLVNPRLRRGRIPERDALFLVHGEGAAINPSWPCDDGWEQVCLDSLGVPFALREWIARWVQVWCELSEGMEGSCTPDYCREFDIQSYNREALAICRELAAALPDGQQVCFLGLKRLGAYYASWLRNTPAPKVEEAEPPAAFDPERWVKVMADIGGIAIWCWWGGPLEYDDLPVTAELKGRLDKWAWSFRSAFGSWHPGEADNFALISQDDRMIAQHSVEGLALACEIKTQLPDWTVLYLDRERGARYRAPSLARFV